MEKDIQMKKISVLLLLTVLSSTALAKIKVIYGDDNRVDVVNSTDAMYVELAHSTAAMISKRDIRSTGDEVLFKGRTLADRGICKDEPFANQVTVANCSGFLVGEDLLVTAGHCIKGKSSCSSYNWVFDFKVAQGDHSSVRVDRKDIYSCKKIINRELNSRNSDDWALIQLDRKVTDRRVLDVRKSGKITVGEELVVIGHPSGLPSKIADGAKVRKLNGKFFTSNLDTYGGNSGSAVFNAKTGLVEGILVRGATDYVYNRAKGCQESNRIGNDAGRGEDVTFITNITELQ